jgi:hypothetical protein
MELDIIKIIDLSGETPEMELYNVPLKFLP